MTIISCIKQVRDLDIVLRDDWVVSEDGRSINIDYANRIMNTFDETSLELMLRLKDASEELHTKVVTIGPIESEKILLKALALGGDKAQRINVTSDIDFSPASVARLLKDSIDEEPDAELVLCGRQADNGSNGMTGQLLAELQGWPCITMVTDIEKIDKEYRLSRIREDGIEHLLVKPPFVASVSQSENKLLRMAGLKAMLEAKKKPIDIVEIDGDAGLADSFSDLEALLINRPDKHCYYIEDTEESSKSVQLVNLLKAQVDDER